MRLNELQSLVETVNGLEKTILKKIRQGTESTVKQIESYMGVRDYFNTGKVGLSFHGWPISSEIGLYLLRLINEKDYDCIIEFGSGTSTLMFAEALIKKSSLGNAVNENQLLENPGGSRVDPNTVERTVFPPSEFDVPKRIVSFEHDKKYFEETSQLLRSQNVLDIVDLVYSPLVDMHIEDRDFLYYSCEEKLKSISHVFQNGGANILILVDGPPQQTGPLARYPALPLLLKHLAMHQIDILIDDYDRPAEREIVENWKETLLSRSIRFSEEMIE
ncbi:MAG TPA: hypothetical protein EYQ14_11710, partial [Gammaproteobacteria bacterium]|nr:hypothetical protein [Gammaproteobacteria bacterium]